MAINYCDLQLTVLKSGSIPIDLFSWILSSMISDSKAVFIVSKIYILGKVALKLKFVEVLVSTGEFNTF